MENDTLKEFRQDLRGNGFVEYVAFTEKHWNKLKAMDWLDLWNAVQRLTDNYRKWNEVTEYIGQCQDIIEEKLAK